MNNKQIKIFIVLLIILVLILVVLCWYFLNSRQPAKNASEQDVKAAIKKEEPASKADKSIKLEKPPFIK